MRKEKFLLCVLFSILFLYYLIPFEWLGPRHGKFFVHPERPAMLIERCQYLEHPVEGGEGDFYNTRRKLKGVVIVFRHGERSPLIKLKNNYGPDCSPYFDIDRRAFDSFSQLVTTDKFREFLVVDPLFPRNFSWHPHSSKCSNGHMTAEGALQLLKLGSYLHEKYKLQGLFDDLNTIDITLSSSVYARTFQSAIAFASTFFYVLDSLTNVHLKASNTTHFCLSNHSPCYCQSYDKIRSMSEAERIKEFHTRTDTSLKQRIKSLGEMVGMDKVDHPLQLFDVILGRYACRRSPFPCQADGDCLTLNDIMQVADESAAIAKRMATESSSVTKSMNIIEAYSLLSHLDLSIQKLKEYGNPKMVKVFSGHDITLEALVHTLNLTDRIPPHYSSRIVFELFESSTPVYGQGLFIRLLYNGVDQTSNVAFCADSLIHGLCPASKFEQFASNGVLKLASLSDLKQIC